MADEIAGLTTGAAFDGTVGDHVGHAICQATADYWQRDIEKWRRFPVIVANLDEGFR